MYKRVDTCPDCGELVEFHSINQEVCTLCRNQRQAHLDASKKKQNTSDTTYLSNGVEIRNDAMGKEIAGTRWT